MVKHTLVVDKMPKPCLLMYFIITEYSELSQISITQLFNIPCISHASDHSKFYCTLGSNHDLIKKEINVNNDLFREQLMPTYC